MPSYLSGFEKAIQEAITEQVAQAMKKFSGDIYTIEQKMETIEYAQYAIQDKMRSLQIKFELLEMRIKEDNSNAE